MGDCLGSVLRTYLRVISIFCVWGTPSAAPTPKKNKCGRGSLRLPTLISVPTHSYTVSNSFPKTDTPNSSPQTPLGVPLGCPLGETPVSPGLSTWGPPGGIPGPPPGGPLGCPLGDPRGVPWAVHPGIPWGDAGGLPRRLRGGSTGGNLGATPGGAPTAASVPRGNVHHPSSPHVSIIPRSSPSQQTRQKPLPPRPIPARPLSPLWTLPTPTPTSFTLLSVLVLFPIPIHHAPSPPCHSVAISFPVGGILIRNCPRRHYQT